MGRIPINREQAIDIACSYIDPDTLERYHTDESPCPTLTTTDTISSDVVSTSVLTSAPRRGSRRRKRWFRGENRSEDVNAVDLNPAQWTSLCRDFGITIPVNQTTVMPQDVRVKVLALTEECVKNSAGLFSNYSRDPKQTLDYFRRAILLPRRPWTYEELVGFCSTRPLSVYHHGKKLKEDDLLGRIEHQLELEEENGRAGYIVCPRSSQVPSNQRLSKLIQAGVINHLNCPRLVPVAYPGNDDPNWVFVKATDLHDMGFPYINFKYLEGFTSNYKHMFVKGSDCFWQGRAYNFQWCDKGDHRFFRFRTKRTMKSGKMEIKISFDKDDDGEWRVRSATCRGCQAGQNCGFCHHIVVGLEGLFAVSRGWIVADEVNGGKMHWGLTQSNSVKAKVPTQKLCVLAGLECLTTFTGCSKTHYNPVMKIFNERLEESQPSSVPLLMVQQLYGTRTDHSRPSTSTKVRIRTGHDNRINSKRRRERFQELVKDNLPKKPTTYEESVEFASSISVNIGRTRTYRGVMKIISNAGYKW